MPGRRALIWGFVLLVGAAYLAFRHFATAYVHWAWFHNLGLAEIFWRSISAQVETAVVGGLLFGAFFYINLRVTIPAVRSLRPEGVPAPYTGWLQAHAARRAVAWIGLAAAVLAGWALSSQWPTLWFFHDAVPFAVTDPLFHRDVADYVFRLPAYELVYGTVGVAFWLSGLAAGAVYFATGWLNFIDGRFSVHPRARVHLSLLLAGYLLLKAVGYRLAAWNLVYSHRGFTFGAGFADVHAALPILRLLMVVAVIAAVLAVLAVAGRRRLLWWGLGGLVGCSLLLGTVYPAIVEDLVVRPSQLQRETPYIGYNIAATRAAFSLDGIALQPFPVAQDLTAQDLQPFQDTFRNIRLWDWQIASPAFQQLQGLRAYYAFAKMNVDRYQVQGQYRQVLIGAREIDYTNLPASSWVNVHTKYTHGYGAAVVPASDIGPEGTPLFWVKDITNTSSVGINITQPRIYFGQNTKPYAIVGPKIDEFDHPQEQGDTYNHYDGSAGIPIGGAFQRLAFSLWAGNYNPLFSSSVGPGARALIYRSLGARLPNLLHSPFLTYDADPYLVISGGRLFWIEDAYTTSAAYPYSTPVQAGGVNYMRNAVKIVVDAYNGTVSYYVADPNDPIIRAEERIFPGVFQPLSNMPPDLRSHVRYPQDFFATQAQVYTRYHMTDPGIFYNNEDPWRIANEIVGSGSGVVGGATGSGAVPPQPMPPYYVILQFPGVPGPQFVLMETFTPTGQSRDNMAAWMAAFSDGTQYGKMVAYEFPKEETVVGPLQVETQINQDSSVAQLLTLWSQGGSEVSRGNLLVIPIRNNFLYVEPLYQTASSTNLPALRRVIVDYGGQQIAVGDTLDAALAQIFGPLPWAPTAGNTPAQPPASTSPPRAGSPAPPSSGGLPAQVGQAQAIYAKALADLKAGDFTGYAQQIQALGQLLQSMGAQSTTPAGAAPAGVAAAVPAKGGAG